ncbi:LacI family DNA-binding transcriptional regulator [Ideonella sp. DXS29W]|uniref:LacI family DNA-binding transcriptional regulator n=1 Tax=Ideonella lacteola TaxID=2984193 RepID=A0ABU9BN08_9BURK
MPDKQKRNVTVRELAKAARVSIGTVSRALRGQPGLSEQTRADVLRIAQELGYDIEKLHTGKPRRILFLYNRAIGALTTNQFYSIVLHGAESACREAGILLSLMSVAPGDDVAAKVRRFESDALLAAGYFESETLVSFQQCELPLVLVDHFHAGIHCVNGDNLNGAWMATRHLLDSGAKTLAAIYGPLSHHSVSLRAKGFRRALFEAQRLLDPDYEVTLDPAIDYDEAGRDAMRRLLKLNPRPDAVFAYNDATALHAIEVCQEAGLEVPKDVRVIGYDDIVAASHSKPALSTVRLDKELMGAVAVEALVRGDVGPADTLLPVELVIRDSSHQSATPRRTTSRRTTAPATTASSSRRSR